jgi:hypothetical protein
MAIQQSFDDVTNLHECREVGWFAKIDIGPKLFGGFYVLGSL